VEANVMFEEGKGGFILFGYVYEIPDGFGDNLRLYDCITLGIFIL